MDPSQLQPGYRLDRYELLCPLAYGGMASVWLARFGGRLGFERMVVVKMILPQYSQDPRFQEMFLDEARIASRIEHTNVARILDVGEHDGSYFIVMEWVDGDSLSKIIRAAEAKKERVPPGVALRICADAAAGLHAAHQLKDRDGTSLGVVHRDVSPQNILVSNNGATMLIDFGVAKARDRVSQETSAGQLKGKIRYMAPEQALGREIDHRADVWAVGAMAYELFSGSPPYDGPNEVATLHKLTSGSKPAPLPASVPSPVRAVIERALSYEAESRFATSLELNLALESAMVEIGEPASTAVVAHYTGQLLAERKAARRRAVEAALTAARERDAVTPSQPVSIGTPVAFPAPPPSAPVSFRATQPLLGADSPSAPSQSSGMGYGEVPSATSSTLGSAAMEYPPESLVDPRARRRRYVGAAFLGVSLAAGVVGGALILTTTVFKREAPSAEPAANAAAAAPPPAPMGAEPPPPQIDLDPKPAETASAATTATAPSSTSAVAATPTATETSAKATPTATAHKPPSWTAPAKPKPPTPAPPSTGGKKDYGF